MSRSAAGMVVSAEIGDANDTNPTNRDLRNERSSKGRRRRAAAEQRRIDQQRWGQYVNDRGEDSTPVVPAMAPSSGNRRRARRNHLYNSRHHLEEDYYEDELAFHASRPRDEICYDFDLEIALSHSLLLDDSTPNSDFDYSSRSVVNMSYESLVQLESVKCVAPVNVISFMLDITFEGNKSEQGLTKEEEKCAICQCEYECGDHIMSLPCTHGFHHSCGSEWLLNYSKLCPICKLDVTDQKSVDM